MKNSSRFFCFRYDKDRPRQNLHIGFWIKSIGQAVPKLQTIISWKKWYKFGQLLIVVIIVLIRFLGSVLTRVLTWLTHLPLKNHSVKSCQLPSSGTWIVYHIDFFILYHWKLKGLFMSDNDYFIKTWAIMHFGFGSIVTTCIVM